MGSPSDVEEGICALSDKLSCDEYTAALESALHVAVKHKKWDNGAVLCSALADAADTPPMCDSSTVSPPLCEATSSSGGSSITGLPGNSRADAVAPPTSEFAWATLVMIGDAYIPYALVVAHSLRAVKTKYDTICMVTPDVTLTGRAALGKVFTHVIEVPYIQYKCAAMKSEKQRVMYNWVNNSFTKWNLLNFTPWRKVAFVDADMVFKQNADDLFELAAPAGCWGNPWEIGSFNKGGIKNFVKIRLFHDAQKNKKHNIRLSAPIPHGLHLDHDTIMGPAVRDKDLTFVVLTALVVLDTSPAMLADLKAMVEKEVAACGFYGTGRRAIVASTWEEVAIAEVTCMNADPTKNKSWTNIHQKYEAVPRKFTWLEEPTFADLAARKDIRAFHMLGSKPLVEGRGKWPDLDVWWSGADALIRDHPDLADYFKG
jgi:hypothetical protein